MRKVEQYDIDVLASTISVIISYENTDIFDIWCIDTHPYVKPIMISLGMLNS